MALLMRRRCLLFFSRSLSTVFFFIHIRLTPRSPLFPYTTLFRSFHSLYRARRRGPKASPRPSNYFVTLRLDRKSTRLNSSHSSISYAVFCLKKKKHDKFVKY